MNLLETSICLLISLIGINSIATAQDSAGQPPAVTFEGATYVLGKVGGDESEFINEYYPEGISAKEAEQFLNVRHFPKLNEVGEFIEPFANRLQARYEDLRIERIETPDPNIDAASYILPLTGGGHEYSLFIAIKVPQFSGLYAKHLVVRSKEEIETFQRRMKEKQSGWFDSLMAVTFPKVIPPRSATRGPVDLSKLPALEEREETMGDFKFGGIEIKGLFVGTPIVVNEAFTEEWENKPPVAPFKVVLPRHESILTLAGGKREGVPELLRVTVADEAKTTALEILRFSNLTIPLQEVPADRLKLCAHTIDTQVLPMVFRGKKEPKVIEFYTTRLGGNDAVVFHGQNVDAKSGEIYFVKVVGILHPSKPGGVLAFLSAQGSMSAITKPEDLRSEGIGLRVMHSLEFIDK